MKLNQKVMLRDGWIQKDVHIPEATIIDLSYYKSSEQIKTVLIRFEDGSSEWFETIALKTE